MGSDLCAPGQRRTSPKLRRDGPSAKFDADGTRVYQEYTDSSASAKNAAPMSSAGATTGL